jgi:hypothetical protein
MATIKLSDQLGAVVDVQPAAASALLRYFRALPALVIENGDLTQAGGLTLDQPAVRSFKTGLAFNDKIDLGNGVDLSVQAGTHGWFSLVRRSEGATGLFGSSVFGEDVEIPEGTCYTRVSLDACAEVSPGGSVDSLSFGVKAGSSLEIANYRSYPLSAGTTIVDTLRETIGGFLIPARTSDLEAIPERGAVSVTGEGSLKLSVDADLLALTNPLAAAKLPGPLPAPRVTAGGTIQVGAAYRIGGEYQMRAFRLDGGRVRIGWYRRKSDEWTVTATASAGVSVGTGEMDLFSTLVKAISADAKADVVELGLAGLSPDQATAILSAVQAAVSRRLELALAVEMSALESGGAAFLYEIDLPRLTTLSRDALDRALQGDLSALHRDTLPGVTCVRSIWTNASEKRVSLDVNLLGIYNFGSIASLMRTGTVLAEPATGALIFTDQITADRVRSAQVNYGADTSKLRHVLAESFLITAVYRGTEQAAGGLSLASSHTFFELRNNTSRQDMLRSLRIGTALGLWSGQEAGLPTEAGDFGRTTVHARTDYDDALTASLFLDTGGRANPREFYENAGRAALQLLVGEGDQDAVRRKPAIDDDLWRKMTASGQPGFGQLFPNLPAPLVGAIVADYSTIVWWADAMAGASRRLAAMRRFSFLNPTASPQNSEFQALRNELASHLAKVAAKTREEFGQPWGLVAMNEASGRRAHANILILGPRFVRAQDNASVLTAGSSRSRNV